MIHSLPALLVFAAVAPASAQVAAPPTPVPQMMSPAPQAPVLTIAVAQQVWNPAASYVTVGQDEPGYRNWYMASARHAALVTSFNQYLTTWGVGGIVPTWQLLRTASQWQRCGGQPFEVPPTSEWPHVVQTLRYIRDYVVPVVGPVEPVSAYRNPVLNACAGGAPDSAHQHFQAVDMVPLRPTTREQLMQSLCAIQLRRGSPYEVGLGFYAFLRFHIDSMKFRKWGAAASNEAASCATPLPRPAIPPAAPLAPTVGQPLASAAPAGLAAGSVTDNPATAH
ncbi:MAG: hypothetical protein ACJ8EY_00655 [Sphingomicrobium sp.]